MTIPEAAGLVIEASVMADAGETYVLDMGEPVSIVELVNRFVARSGAKAPELRFTGLRPGEKLHEQLFDSAEHVMTTQHPHIWTVQARDTLPVRFRERVNHLYGLAALGRVDDLLRQLDELLPDHSDGASDEASIRSRPAFGQGPRPLLRGSMYPNIRRAWRERAHVLQLAAGAAGVVGVP